LRTQIRRSVEHIYRALIARINRETAAVEEEMQTIAKRLEEEPESIEAMDALRIFCVTTLEEELARLKATIDGIMQKLDLLEVFYVEISPEDFHRTWSIYGMPLEIREKRDDCLMRLRTVEIRLTDSLATQKQTLA
jgi:dynein heavy chain